LHVSLSVYSLYSLYIFAVIAVLSRPICDVSVAYGPLSQINIFSLVPVT